MWAAGAVMTLALPHTLERRLHPRDRGGEIAVLAVVAFGALGYITLRLLGLPLWIWFHVRAAGNLEARDRVTTFSHRLRMPTGGSCPSRTW